MIKYPKNVDDYAQNTQLMNIQMVKNYKQNQNRILSQKDYEYFGEFQNDQKNGFGEEFNYGTKFKGYFRNDKKNGSGVMITADNKKIIGHWNDNELISFKGSIPKRLIHWIQTNSIQFQFYISQFYVQQYLRLMSDFTNKNNYIRLLNNKKMVPRYLKISITWAYFIIAMVMRPILIDFLGPFIPIFGGFIIVKKEGQKQCGGIDVESVKYINIVVVGISNIAQILIVVIIFWIFRKQTVYQPQVYHRISKNKAELSRIDYCQRYSSKFFLDEKHKLFREIQQNQSYQNQNSQQIEQKQKLTKQESSSSIVVLDFKSRTNKNRRTRLPPIQEISDTKNYMNKQLAQFGQDLIKQKYKEKEMIDNKTEIINENYKMKQKFKFDIFKAIQDMFLILSSIRFDLDLLTDSDAIFTCYALSQSQNFGEQIRNDLRLYFKISLIVFMISLIPRYNCFVFFLLRKIAFKMGILTQRQNKKGQQEDERGYIKMSSFQERMEKERKMKYQEILKYEDKGLLSKIVFWIYRQSALLYGINYKKDIIRQNYYITKSNNIDTDINLLFYTNHEDNFTAKLMEGMYKVEDKMFDQKVGLEVHSTFRMVFFRTFFENIPQLIVQTQMILCLQQSGVDSCHKTPSEFKFSLIITIINLLSGLYVLAVMLITKLMEGDLVSYRLAIYFKMYLKELGIKSSQKKLNIDNEFEFWTKMNSQLYQFLILNENYTTVRFGKKIIFKQKIAVLFPTLNFILKQQPIQRTINIQFEEQQNKSVEQMFAELISIVIYSNRQDKKAKVIYIQKEDQNKLMITSKFYFSETLDQWSRFNNLYQKYFEFSKNFQLQFTDIASISYLKKVQQILGLQRNKLSVIVYDKILNLRVLKLKQSLDKSRLVYKFQRIKNLLDVNHDIIQGIELDDDPKTAYQWLLENKDRLGNLKVEFENQYELGWNGQTIDQISKDYQVLQPVFSFEQMTVELDGHKCRFNYEYLKIFKEQKIKAIVLKGFCFDQYYDQDLFDLIYQMVQQNPRLQIVHRLFESHDNKDELREQSKEDMKEVVVTQNSHDCYEFSSQTLGDFFIERQMKVDQLILTKGFQHEKAENHVSLDQFLTLHLKQDRYHQILKNISKLEIVIYGNILEKMRFYIQQQFSILKAQYKLENLQLNIQTSELEISDLLDLTQVMQQQYESLMTIEIYFDKLKDDHKDFRYQVVSLIKDQHQDLEVYQTRYTHYHQY